MSLRGMSCLGICALVRTWCSGCVPVTLAAELLSDILADILADPLADLLADVLVDLLADLLADPEHPAADM